MLPRLSLRTSLVTILLLASGCVSSRWRMEPAGFEPRTQAREEIVLKTLGEPGQAFAGHLVIDGEQRAISGVTPAEFPLTVCVMSGQLRKLSGGGTLSFRIDRAHGFLGFGTLNRPGSFCRFRYHDGGVEVRER